MSDLKLGKWAVIDIETSGVNPLEDSIIDIGFYRFEDFKLVEVYQSLVRYEGELSQFIQQLTGITNSMVHKAPRWQEVEQKLGDLEGHALIAHNSDFEKSFLSQYFDDDVEFVDSIPFLGLLKPGTSSLSLEHFIQEFKIADKEEHRGLSDARDLLKVMLKASYHSYQKPALRESLAEGYEKFHLSSEWFYKFLKLSKDELVAVADEIEFDVLELEEAKEDHKNTSVDPIDTGFSGQNIQKVFQDKNRWEESLGHYQYRESQEQLALKVGQSFHNNVHAIVQAPTGTGKTLGYLVPSAMYSKSTGNPVLVATGTKALQAQAVNKDVPIARRLLGLDENEWKVEKLIGSQNHLCELQYRQRMREEGMLLASKDINTRYAYLYLNQVFENNLLDEAQLTREDIPYVLKLRWDGEEGLSILEKDSKVDYRACTGKRCAFAGQCTYFQGLVRAKDADVVVGNHALMFHWPRGFERPSKIIVDEAHKLEGEATGAFSLSLGLKELKRYQKTLENAQFLGPLFYLLEEREEERNKLKEQSLSTASLLSEHLEPLEEIVEQYFKQLPRFTEIYWNETSFLSKDEINNEVYATLYNHLDSIHFIMRGWHETLLPYSTEFDLNQMKREIDMDAAARFQSSFGNLEEMSVSLSKLFEDSGDYVRVLKYHAKYGFEMLIQPINVGELVYENLLKDSESVVYTSATIGQEDGQKGTRGIEWWTGYQYLEPQRRFKTPFFLPSVFDYKKNSRVFFCDDTPDFYHPQFIPVILDDLVKLIKTLGGRSLLLFSSRVRFETAREILIEKLRGQIPLFIQGMGQQVIQDFQKSERGVLLGMEVFGEGIDIPGETLSFLFVDKVPDMRRDIVIEERRKFYQTHFGNEFVDYFLSYRARSLQQKLGRLIRKEDDRGAAIVVDSRLRRWKGRTKKDFFDLLSPYEVQHAKFDEAIGESLKFIQE